MPELLFCGDSFPFVEFGFSDENHLNMFFEKRIQMA